MTEQSDADFVAEFKKAYAGRLSVTGLLPCPFCGSIHLAMITVPAKEESPAVNFLQCNDCGATGPNMDTKELVRIGWDKRAEIA